MSSAPRKQAPRLARPAARYWKGKAPKGVTEAESDSDAEEDAEEDLQPDDVAIGGELLAEDDDDDDLQLRTDESKPVKAMNISLKEVNISKEGKVIVAGREESGRTAVEEEDETDESESDEEEAKVAPKAEADDSSEYESESEEEKPVQRRVLFVPKQKRVTIAERDAIAQENEEAIANRQLEAEQRKKAAHDLVAESIKREQAEKAKEDDEPMVDDTDGLDPEGEFEAWRMRELERIKKEKDAEIQREEERAEIERRRAMPEEQRLKEDLERANKLREEKPKGQQKFLQKYWHKGAFHQDEDILTRHDFTEATQSTVDVSMLPKVMQVKNWGKRSRTKYTHLLDQDTTAKVGGFGGAGSIQSGGNSTDSGGCFLCGGPHMKKDCPQNSNSGPLSERGTGASGSNAIPTSARMGPPDGTRNWRHDDDGHLGRNRDKDRERWDAVNRRRSRSSSRTPPPRRRSRDRSVDRDYRDKRRRVD